MKPTMESTTRFVVTQRRNAKRTMVASLRRLSVMAVVALALLAVTGLGANPAALAKDLKGNDHGLKWVTAWATSPQGPSQAGFPAEPLPLEDVFPGNQATNQTLRLVVHSGASGHEVRIRLSNLVGTQSVTFGSVYIGIRESGAVLVFDSNRQVLFDGQSSITIPSGGEVLSDPVRIKVRAQEDLAVSLFVSGNSGPMTWHAKALTTSYATGPGTGDSAADESDIAFSYPIRSWFWLNEIQVAVPPNRESGTIVALGDSITDGSASTIDGNDRWPDFLARRLLESPGGLKKTVANEGIGGNRVVTVPYGPVLGPLLGQPADSPCVHCGDIALVRLERDVLDRPNVTHVILFEGVNDIGGGASATEIIAGMQEVIRRVRQRGITIIGATITPYGGSLYSSLFPDSIRQEVNTWIRTSGAFDAVLDFDAVVRDPADPTRIDPMYDPGDHIHFNPEGYQAVADSIPLSLFDDRPHGVHGHRSGH